MYTQTHRVQLNVWADRYTSVSIVLLVAFHKMVSSTYLPLSVPLPLLAALHTTTLESKGASEGLTADEYTLTSIWNIVDSSC